MLHQRQLCCRSLRNDDSATNRANQREQPIIAASPVVIARAQPEAIQREGLLRLDCFTNGNYVAAHFAMTTLPRTARTNASNPSLRASLPSLRRAPRHCEGVARSNPV
ncbi:MAG: hypothetical protein LBT00_00050 [Spirochaetaceae bacterium]|nr:hypothetical protein [Spirochaetaceae bacterium]